ncbi:hypothetical protein ACFLQ2_05730 [archaeon]
MNTEYAVTAFLVAAAGMLALGSGIPQLVSAEYLALAVVAGLLAAFIDAYRIKVLIEEGAKSTVEYMSVQKPINVTFNAPMGGQSVLGTQTVEQMVFGLQKQMTKAMGKSLLAFEKVVEVSVKAIAAFSGIALLAGGFVGIEPTFALGLWMILSTLAVTALMKMSGFFSFAFGLVSQSFVPLNSYTGKAKQLIAAIAGAGIAAWLLYSVQWVVVMAAFGSDANLIAVFLLYALVWLFSFAPYSVMGIGWMELAAVLVLPLAGASAGAVFLAVIVWEMTRLAGGFASYRLLEKQQDLSHYK